jgi:hypothetical protein
MNTPNRYTKLPFDGSSSSRIAPISLRRERRAWALFMRYFATTCAQTNAREQRARKMIPDAAIARSTAYERRAANPSSGNS